MSKPMKHKTWNYMQTKKLKHFATMFSSIWKQTKNLFYFQNIFFLFLRRKICLLSNFPLNSWMLDSKLVQNRYSLFPLNLIDRFVLSTKSHLYHSMICCFFITILHILHAHESAIIISTISLTWRIEKRLRVLNILLIFFNTIFNLAFRMHKYL